MIKDSFSLAYCSTAGDNCTGVGLTCDKAVQSIANIIRKTAGDLIGPEQQTEMATKLFDEMLGQTGDGGTTTFRIGGITYFLSLARVFIHNVYV